MPGRFNPACLKISFIILYAFVKNTGLCLGKICRLKVVYLAGCGQQIADRARLYRFFDIRFGFAEYGSCDG